MDDKTTTDAPADNAGASQVGVVNGVAIDSEGRAIPEAQPVAVEEPSAAEEATETPAEDQEPKAEPSESTQTDEELNAWAKNKGLELDSDSAIKAAKMAREAERAMHQKAREKSELEKSLIPASDNYAEQVAQQTGENPELLKRLQRIEVKDAVRNFYDANPDAQSREQEIVAVLNQRPHLAGDLEAAYAIVKSSNLDAVKSQGGQEALQTLAQKQQAAVPTGNAVTPSGGSATKITPQNVDALVGSHDVKWYQDHQKEINAAMAG